MTNKMSEKERIRQEAAITRMVMAVTSVDFICMVPGRLLLGVLKAVLLCNERQMIYSILTYLELSNFFS